jgi:hypothetical protein
MTFKSGFPFPLDIQAGVSNMFLGATVASATSIVPTGNYFPVSGTTTITAVDGTGLNPGARITMVFSSAGCTVQHGAALVLRGGVNFVSAAGDALTLDWTGTLWQETSRQFGLDQTTLHSNVAGELAGLTLKATPVSTDILLLESVADSNAKRRATLASAVASLLGPQSVGNTDTITTTSTTDVLATNCSITPGAGTYLVWFSCSVASSANSKFVYTSIYANNGKSANSEQSGNPKNSGDLHSHCCVALVTVAAAQAIEGRWRVQTGSTGSMYTRNLTILRVA